MKTVRKLLLIFFLGLFSLSSCEKIFIEEEQSADNAAVFDYMWDIVDRKYSFFEDKRIDWDSAKTVFRTKAINAQNSLQLFNVLSETLYILEDGHVNISAGFDVSRNWEWYLGYPANFNWDLIERNYLVESEAYQISGSLHNTIIDDVGYIYYESFSNNISTGILDYILFKFETGNFKCSDTCGVKGLIIDVRNNGGGSIANAFTFTNRFTKEKTKVSDWYYKLGPDHNDFSEAVPQYIAFEGDEEYQFDKPIVVLTNRSSYSSANFFASMMSFLPNVTLMGDVTGGGGGLPINSELPNGWRIRFSSTRTIDANGNNIEFGVVPDVRINLDSADVNQGKDTMIENAIQLIKGN